MRKGRMVMDGGPELDMERMYFDKWEMYRCMVGAKRVVSLCHLPVTQRLRPGVATSMLTRFDCVYIKPVDTWGGTCITRVHKTDDGYIRRSHPSVATHLLPSELEEDIASLYGDRHCVVQQGAPILSYNGRPFDIRVHMQRDMNDAWVFAGALVRIAGEEGVVSNVGLTNGQVLPVDHVVTSLFGFRKTRVAAVITSLPTVGREICAALDRYYEFEEVGADFGVDHRGGLWLFEVNTDDAYGRPSRELFSRLPTCDLYNAIQKRSDERDVATLQAVARALLGRT